MAVSKRKPPHAVSGATAAAAVDGDDESAAPVQPFFAPVSEHQQRWGVVFDDYRSGSAYISAAGIANLKHYKYTGSDLSFLGNLFLFRVYGWMAYQTPMWLAPNVITLAGFVCNFAALALCFASIEPMFDGGVAASPLVYVAVGSLIWLYQAFDNMDGKQARRTGSSSALGELFDHVCDCTCITVFTMVVASCVGVGVYQMLVMSWLSIFGFHLAHWEEYYKGALIMGVFNGPTEAVLTIIAVIYLTALVGPAWWHTPVPGVPALDKATLLLGVFYGSAVLTSLQYTKSTLAACRELGVSLTQALSELVPLLLGAGANAVWFAASVSLNGWQRDIAAQAPVTFMLQAGIFIAYLETRLLTQRICRERAPVLYLINAPAVVAALLTTLAANGIVTIDELTLVYAVFAVHLALFANVVFGITQQITAALKINVFTIPH